LDALNFSTFVPVFLETTQWFKWWKPWILLCFGTLDRFLSQILCNFGWIIINKTMIQIKEGAAFYGLKFVTVEEM
jgi:hypothetical protein